MALKFPDNFLFGVGSSSYQIEGAHNRDGKGEHIWDRFVESRKQLVVDGSNGNDACKSYDLYKEDVKALKQMKVHFYRFSICWTRICPNGDVGTLNKKGIDYYNDLINLLIENDITPMVTLYHWELPQTLQNLGGWTNPHLASFFEDFARVIFSLYGDRVKWWFTLNEPHLHTAFGYGHYGNTFLPTHAPDKKMLGFSEYLAGHTMLLSHARVYRMYHKEFFAKQQGKVGIVVDCFNHMPASDKFEDIEAAERARIFEVGWILHPIYVGDYPPLMRQRIDANSKAQGLPRSRLPNFTTDEINLIKGSADFVGLNHYTTYLSNHDEHLSEGPSMANDAAFKDSFNPAAMTANPMWIKMEPNGFRHLLNWLKQQYNNPPIFIAENGCADSDPVNDVVKVDYHKQYLSALLKAIHEDGCNVFAYAAWSLLDSFEWTSGYTEKFGFYHVDFSDPNRKRTPKKSASFYRQVIETRRIDH